MFEKLDTQVFWTKSLCIKITENHTHKSQVHFKGLELKNIKGVDICLPAHSGQCPFQLSTSLNFLEQKR